MNSQTTDKHEERGRGILLRLLLIAGALIVTTLISTVKAKAQIVVANLEIPKESDPSALLRK